MNTFMMQQNLIRGSQSTQSSQWGISTCGQIWDARNARFTQCTLPFIAALPAVLAVFVLLGAFVRLSPWPLPIPRWLRPFVKEPEIRKHGLSVRHKYHFRLASYLLLLLSAIGLGSQTAAGIYPVIRKDMIFPAVSWLAIIALLIIEHSATTPFSILVLNITILTSQAIVYVDGTLEADQGFNLSHAIVLVAISAAFASSVVIFLMPMRHPMLFNDDISKAFTPPTSEFRSPEDNLTLWQWSTASWVAPLLTLAKNQDMNNENVWDLGYEFKHALLHQKFRRLEGSVLRRLMKANGRDLLITAVLGILRVMCSLSFPVLLQQLLRTLQDKDASQEAALKYAILTLVAEMIANQLDLFGTWFGRRGYERSRGEMITMLYEKSLSRKVISVSSKPKEETKTANGNAHTKDLEQTKLQKFTAYVTACFRRKPKKTKEEIAEEKAKDMASTGKIMNLMRGDAYEVAQLIWDFSDVIQAPIRLVLCGILIWKLLGWSCLLAGFTVVIAQIIHVTIARATIPWSKKRRSASDKKTHKVSEVVESIRHLRWYGWQDVWLTRIMEARMKELHLRVIMYLWSTLINLFNTFASGMFPVIAFYGYTILAGKPLTVDIAFPAIQLFNLLEWNLQEIPYYITAYMNAWVAMGRIEDFMKEADKEEAEDQLISTGDINIEKASFAWPGVKEPTLKDISITLSAGLNVICGEVGSGKSALLLAILGEMDQLEGIYRRTNRIVAYCGMPWLQSMSIRDNVLFSAHYDEDRYQQVLEACALVPDMAGFKHGDKSLIGENGVGLSGGQKARVSLARAVYSQAEILLLDDPLAALDHQTAEWIVRKCFKGPLLDGRTVVLVTHRVALCIGLADQVYEMSIDGHAKRLDPKANPCFETHTSSNEQDDAQIRFVDEEQKSRNAPEKFMEEEHRSRGGVKLSVYWEYIKAGKLRWWFAVVVVVSLLRLIDVAETWFLKEWGEAYSGKKSRGPFGELPAPYINIRPWLIGFFLFAVAHSVAFLITQTFMLVVVYNSGKQLFERVMQKCTHATFRFYDVTPVGMLMNRLTSDINTVDGNISNQLRSIVGSAVAWTSAIVVIASITPLYLLVSSVMAIMFVVTFNHFLPASQSLRRLEMVSLTPLISNFGEVTAGLTTIRAYGASARFQARVIAVTDTFQSLDHFYWSVQTWLMIRFDTLSSVGTFIVTVMAIYTGLSAGLTAFVLNSAERFVWSTQQLCKKYGQLQMDFVSVERVVELLELEQESPGDIEPPAYWPTLGGDIVFENVTIRYASHLDPALHNINLTIKGGSTTALIGRTGSGKSTLALSLLATTPPSEGTILIDGIDISKVNKQILRQRITFLAQDPVLFPGTMRENLDPLNEYSDEECLHVLGKIADRHAWALETHIDTGGKNLSQGQRQLVGLARALLRRSAIIIMDEATASIDMETAMRIQEILREEMKDSTVVTIAHRVEAVKDAQRCVVLGKGKVIEEGAVGEVGLNME